ncbi:hypothetical protein AB0N09_34000 [Streptomyces erythrochromogenes]|uniref:hypothetical protein n=1 Tax=Streptomyces erythrochromogenes TaxID=285574 RepID=UPI00341D711B
MQHLGPLELVGDRWVIGDSTRESGLFIALAPEGLEHRRRGETRPLAGVEWGNFVGLGVNAAYRSRQTGPAAGVVEALRHVNWGRDGCSLQGSLRHPYEDWSARYTHHERRYRAGHVIVLQALFDDLSAAKALHRLGDPEWLGSAVSELSSYTSWYAPKGHRLVKATIRTLGV